MIEQKDNSQLSQWLSCSTLLLVQIPTNLSFVSMLTNTALAAYEPGALEQIVHLPRLTEASICLTHQISHLALNQLFIRH